MSLRRRRRRVLDTYIEKTGLLHKIEEEIEHHGGGNYGTEKTAAADLVNTGDGAIALPSCLAFEIGSGP